MVPAPAARGARWRPCRGVSHDGAGWSGSTREAIASIAPATTDHPRVRGARSPCARHDAEDDRVRVRDLDQHSRQPRRQRVYEARRSRRCSGGARAPGRPLLLRNPRRFRAHPRAPQGEPLDIVLTMTSSLKGLIGTSAAHICRVSRAFDSTAVRSCPQQFTPMDAQNNAPGSPDPLKTTERVR
jgi:hypothetical protein